MADVKPKILFTANLLTRSFSKLLKYQKKAMLKKRFALLGQGLRFWFIPCFLLLSLVSIGQQKISVGGRVISDKGDPLPDVSVKVENQTTGTITAADGTFSLRVNKGATLVFSIIGYQDRKINIDRERSGLAVQLSA
ncbi:MAG: carboxypeptidase-like regulatory domain-containing protein, partial [Chitinophagaceae bacterium]